MTVDALLHAPESKTLEFKRDLSSPRPVLGTIVAFANTAGGQLVLGVEDGPGEVRGVADPLAMEQRLASLVSDSISPQLLPEIEIVPWRRLQLVVVRVHPSALRPHHVVADGVARGTYVRLGSTNRVADPELIAELRRRPMSGTFDEQPMENLGADAIDLDAVHLAFEGRREIRQRDLETLGILVMHAGRPVPSAGGYILFGRERAARFPDAWMQVGRFGGTDRSSLADRAELHEHPVRALEAAVGFVERNTRRGADIGRLYRRDVPAVPPVALREALVNAVVHADYAQRGAPIRVAVFDDRVEIENPGILLPGLTFDDLRDGVSRLRNRVIGRVFKELGLIEQWGSGIRRMTDACVSAGLPAPDLAEVGLRFRVTLWTSGDASAIADPVDQVLLGHLEAPDGLSTADLSALLGRTPRAIQQRLARLAAQGSVVAVGTGPRDPRRRWYRTSIPR